MILKAYILSTPADGSNEFRIRIPYFEGNSNKEVVYTALLCNQPGEYDGYKEGDCVWVSFEDTRLNVPVILGKLFVDKDDSVKNTHIVNNLKVTGTIDLPATTTIGGYTTVDIFKNFQRDADATSGTGNLDYDDMGSFSPRISFEIVDYWPYDPSQEAICTTWYPVYVIEWEDAESSESM